MDSLAVTLLVIMLPGIISAVIADKLVSHDRWSSFKFTLYAFVLGVGSYVLLQLVIWLINFSSSFYSFIFTFDFNSINWKFLKTWDAIENEDPSITSWELIIASLLSILVAFSASWTINHKVFNKIGRKIGVTTKYGDENLYSYFLNAQGICWVYVRDKEQGLTYQGQIVSFSETDTMQELVLDKVSVFTYEDPVLLYEVPSIYLIKEMGKFVIEVVPFELLEVVENDR